MGDWKKADGRRGSRPSNPEFAKTMVGGGSGSTPTEEPIVRQKKTIKHLCFLCLFVAIIDTSVDWNHPDLEANIWSNALENPTHGMDDDANGYVDDIRGWDFVDVTQSDSFSVGEDIGPEDNDPMDFYGTDDEIYPAAYHRVLGVAATDQLDRRSIWGEPQPPLWQGNASSYGSWVSVAAPGTDILSTGFDDTYETNNGTSVAAPAAPVWRR